MIEYEFSYIPLSSSKRDLDNNSEFDKFESFLAKQDESLIIQTDVSAKSTMQMIEMKFGPFNIDEISFYKKNLSDSSYRPVINEFQKTLVFNLFYKYFGDPQSTKAINLDDYIKLIISSKKILEANSLVILPYIISSKIVRLASRRNINKKELIKLESSELWEKVKEKYKSEKIEKYIQNIIAQILTSEFQIIDYNDKDLNGKTIDVIPELIIEEVLLYILLI